MADVLFLLVGAAFLVATYGLIRLCQKLMEG